MGKNSKRNRHTGKINAYKRGIIEAKKLLKDKPKDRVYIGKIVKNKRGSGSIQIVRI